MTKREKSKTYIYDVGNKDKVRLGLLNDVYNPLSQQALLDIDISDKKCVFDMGCGQGEMACWMAKQVLPYGEVIGVDSSEEQLFFARKRAKKYGLKNIQFIKKSVLDEDFTEAIKHASLSPDFIYSRWLLIHIETGKIHNVMQKFYDLLLSDGVMVHEEVSLMKSFLNQPSKAFLEYVNLFTQLAKKLNIDFDLGSNLQKLFSRTGYLTADLKIIQPGYTKDQLKFFQLDLLSAVPQFEKYNLAGPNEIDALSRLFDREIKGGINMTMTNYYVYGKK